MHFDRRPDHSMHKGIERCARLLSPRFPGELGVLAVHPLSSTQQGAELPTTPVLYRWSRARLPMISVISASRLSGHHPNNSSWVNASTLRFRLHARQRCPFELCEIAGASANQLARRNSGTTAKPRTTSAIVESVAIVDGVAANRDRGGQLANRTPRSYGAPGSSGRLGRGHHSPALVVGEGREFSNERLQLGRYLASSAAIHAG